jgi:hypothetical protein
MADLIDLALAGHGGIDRWKQVKSIEVELTISGALLELKGFPEHLRTSVLIDVDQPYSVLRPYGGADRRGISVLDAYGLRRRTESSSRIVPIPARPSRAILERPPGTGALTSASCHKRTSVFCPESEQVP